MYSPTILADFTGAYDRQPFAVRPGVVRIPFRDMAGTNCYCDAEAEAEIRRRLAPYPLRGVHFLDSGNYHYLSALWMERLTRPFVLALFDRHSDLQPPAFGNLLSCGSWVRRLLDTHPLLRRVCIVGAPADPTAEAVYGDRVVFCDPDPSDGRWSGFLAGNDPVYVSVDKDVLDPVWAATNWDQGMLSLPVLETMLTDLLATGPLLGADICGEPGYGPHEAPFRLNDRTNSALLSLFSRYL